MTPASLDGLFSAVLQQASFAVRVAA